MDAGDGRALTHAATAGNGPGIIIPPEAFKLARKGRTKTDPVGGIALDTPRAMRVQDKKSGAVSELRAIDATFPRWQAVVPGDPERPDVLAGAPEGSKRVKVTFNPWLLLALAEAMGCDKTQQNLVRVELCAEPSEDGRLDVNSPVVLTAPQAPDGCYSIMMPARIA